MDERQAEALITSLPGMQKSRHKAPRYHVASPALVKSRPVVKTPADLKSWPWLSLAGAQFGGSKEVKLYSTKGGEVTLPISPISISEGATSMREAARTGLGPKRRVTSTEVKF
jgi:hypothetical protein